MGLAARSKEGPRLVTGHGRYTDDFTEPGMLQAVFLRSPHAHARIVGVDATAALNRPDVFAVVTPEDMKRDTKPFRPGRYAAGLKKPIAEYAGAVDKVRYVGEPVGAVAARDRSTAEDVLESIAVDYEILPANTDVHQAMAGEDPAVIYEELGANLAWQGTLEYGDTETAFREADRVVRGKPQDPPLQLDAAGAAGVHRLLRPLQPQAHGAHQHPGARKHLRRAYGTLSSWTTSASSSRTSAAASARRST